MRILFDFAGDPSESRWAAVNDDVMGGRSRSQPTVSDGMLTFNGTLSLENNGGFASIRTVDYRVDLSSFRTIVLRVSGDGRRYQLRLHSDAEYRGIVVAYGAEFVAPVGAWIDVRLDLVALQPRVRGTLLNGPPLNASKVRQMGILIGDKQAGPFSLAIDWIGAE